MASIQQPQLDAAIESLYLAASDAARWPAALQNLSRAFDSPRVAVIRTPPSLLGVHVMHQLNHDAEAQRLYGEHYWQLDPTLERTRRTAVGELLDAGSLLDPRTTPSREYADYALKHGIRWVTGGKVHADTDSCTILSLQRPADHRPFDEDTVHLYRRLAPHVGRAAVLGWDLRRAELARGVSAAALDAIECAVYAVRADGSLLLANAAGERELAGLFPFRVHAGRLGAVTADQAVALARALKSAAAGAGSGFRVAAQRRSCLVRVLPLPAQPGVVLVFAAPANRPPAPVDVLRAVLQLSAAQADIAFLLAEGLGIKEIAFRRRASVHTVRAQVREIYRRCAVRKQTELARLLASMPRLG